jgi:hypothetical protein
MLEVTTQNCANNYKLLFLLLRPVVILLCRTYYLHVDVDFAKFIRHTEAQIFIQSTRFEIIEFKTKSRAQLVGILIFIYKINFMPLYVIYKY